MRSTDSVLCALLLIINGSEGFTSPRASNAFVPSCSLERRQKLSVAAAVPDMASFLSDSFFTVSSTVTAIQTSPEPIHSAFSVATFLPQPFWMLIILFPKQKITKQIMGGLGKSDQIMSFD